MRYQWPNRLTLAFTLNGVAVENLLVFVSLLSDKKNDFGLGPRLSDERGQVILKRADLREAVETEKEDFPMDYDGGLEDCFGIDVTVETREHLGDRLNRLRQYYPESAGELERRIKRSSNVIEKSFTWRGTLPFDNNVVEIDIGSFWDSNLNSQ